MDASPVVVIQHHHLGTSMPSGGVHTITVVAEHFPHEITVPIKPDILAALTLCCPLARPRRPL
jgi:hypothetical protein